MTKEELLQKGVSEAVADEIIAEMGEQSESSIETLSKALSDPEMGNLFKASKTEEEEEEEGEGEEEYDDKFMKKMNRYMKENKDKMANLFGSKDKLEKAVDNFDYDKDGAIVEMEDLRPILEGQSEVNKSMTKAIMTLSEKVDKVIGLAAENYNIMTKAARVQVEQAKSLDGFLGQSQGRKGVTASLDMQKAQAQTASKSNAIVYQTLMKAVRNGDARAGHIISVFESAGKNINVLDASQKSYIQELISAEGK